MANRFSTPNPQFCDNTGLPYSGGSLFFYASGTTTPLATYSDKALTIPNANPIVLDSAGRAGSVFLQNLAYKVILQDSNGNTVWTADPVYSSDFSALAQFQSGSGSPNGSVAGTAGSSTIPASSYWDYTNGILYICTQTGTTSTAVWTAINAGSTTSVIPAPQGRLTPVTATPVIASDSVGVTTVYYTPYVGNLIPIYNGSTFVPTTFSEIGLSLVSAHAASTIYDVFVFNNSGVLTLVTGPAWSVSTAGSGARGSGAGTTQISRLNGFWVNTVSMTGRNGSTTYSIPASQATYVGSIFIDATPGQVSCYLSYGQSRKWGIWNAYNRNRILLKAGDSTASWPVTSTAATKAANGASANSVTVFCGLPDESVQASEFQKAQVAGTITGNGPSGTYTVTAQNSIGLNSTSSASGTSGWYQNAWTLNNNSNTVSNTMTNQGEMVARFSVAPFIGINTLTALETSTVTLTAATATLTYFGTEANMLLSAEWLG